MKYKDMTAEQKEEYKARQRKHQAKYREEHCEEYKAYHRKYRDEHSEECIVRQKKYRAEHREEHNARQRKYRAEDLNKNGVRKNRIRFASRQILKKVHAKLYRYEIHHCFGYEDPDKFIYIPKTLHTQIHKLLRDNNISADSDHWMVIRDLVNSCDQYTYISV